jgi:hypothetical protein
MASEAKNSCGCAGSFARTAIRKTMPGAGSAISSSIDERFPKKRKLGECHFLPAYSSGTANGSSPVNNAPCPRKRVSARFYINKKTPLGCCRREESWCGSRYLASVAAMTAPCEGARSVVVSGLKSLLLLLGLLVFSLSAHTVSFGTIHDVWVLVRIEVNDTIIRLYEA